MRIILIPAAEHVMKEITGETDFLRDFIEQLKAQEEVRKNRKKMKSVYFLYTTCIPWYTRVEKC